MEIAIIGSGISGLSSAVLLSGEHKITLIENGIPQQLKFDILNHSPYEDRRAEAIKNEVTFGTCYRKDSNSKYYAQLFSDLESKTNKSLEEYIYSQHQFSL